MYMHNYVAEDYSRKKTERSRSRLRQETEPKGSLQTLWAASKSGYTVEPLLSGHPRGNGNWLELEFEVKNKGFLGKDSFFSKD